MFRFHSLILPLPHSRDLRSETPVLYVARSGRRTGSHTQMRTHLPPPLRVALWRQMERQKKKHVQGRYSKPLTRILDAEARLLNPDGTSFESRRVTHDMDDIEHTSESRSRIHDW